MTTADAIAMWTFSSRTLQRNSSVQQILDYCDPSIAGPREHFEEITPVVGPQHGWRWGMAVRLKANRLGENFRTAGDERPQGVFRGARGIGATLEHDPGQAIFGRQSRNHGAKIEVQVRNVERQNAIGFDVLQIDR